MRELQIRADGIGQLARIVAADGRDHGVVVDVLAELDVLLEQAGDARGQRVQLRPGLDLEAEGLDGGAEKAFFLADREDFAALHAFHQHLDVAVGLLQALDDVGDGADGKDLVGARLVDAGVVLGGQEDLLVAGQRLFQRPHARFAAHHERRHHVREDDHVPDGHHRQAACFGFFFGSKHCKEDCE